MCLGLSLGTMVSIVFDFDLMYGIIGDLLFGMLFVPIFSGNNKIEIKFRKKSKKKKQSKTK